jgi:co-chaperonin GroES (HSP10)
MYEPIKINKLTPLKDFILVTDMNFHERIGNGGIIIPMDDKKSSGIRPRWGQVYAVGPEQTEIKAGDWVCVAHGRWTRGSKINDGNGIHTVRRIDNKDILLVSDELPVDTTIGDAA